MSEHAAFELNVVDVGENDVDVVVELDFVVAGKDVVEEAVAEDVVVAFGVANAVVVAVAVVNADVVAVVVELDVSICFEKAEDEKLESELFFPNLLFSKENKLK